MIANSFRGIKYFIVLTDNYISWREINLWTYEEEMLNRFKGYKHLVET